MSDVHFTPIDIPISTDRSQYPAIVLTKVNELFAVDPSPVEILIGLDVMGFVSRRAEGQFFQELRRLGYKYAMVVSWGGGDPVRVGVAIAKEKTTLTHPPTWLEKETGFWTTPSAELDALMVELSDDLDAALTATPPDLSTEESRLAWATTLVKSANSKD